RTGLTIKAALFLGFGVALGVWLVVGYRLTQRFTDVESAAAAVNARYLQAQERLREVDAQARLASVLVRDALLATDSTTADLDRGRLEATYVAAYASLDQYVPVLDSNAERDAVTRLRREIEAFRLAMQAVYRAPSPAASRAVLQQRVVPQRDIVLRVSARAQALNREAFVAQTLSTAQVYRTAQRDGWQQLGLALAANLMIGVWAGVYAGRLENRLRQQRIRDLQLTNDLHRLSARIVSAQEDERRMIARELHDEVGQTLAAIRVELAFAQRPNADASQIAARLEDVRAITEGALHTIRDLSHLLHPAMLDDLGLMASLESLIANFRTRHDVRVELRQQNMTSRLPTDLETAIYRIVQEGLNNVAKHASATTCVVSIGREGDWVHVAIEDDGVGFSSESGTDAARHGLGLIGIRERAALLQGAFSVVTAPGRGTQLLVQLPIAGV
ncbi:MAG: sensor histidine kinase, partial [Acidobacteria bacterium]